MIKSIHDKESEKIFARKRSRKLPTTIQHISLRKLLMIDAAVTINDLRIPSANRLEALHGKRNGQHSIRINRQWRICFIWRNGDAFNVEITDYH